MFDNLLHGLQVIERHNYSTTDGPTRQAPNVQFQKISIPTPRRMIGNSKGEEVSKAKFFKTNKETNRNFQRGGRLQQQQKKKNEKKPLDLLEGYIYFLAHYNYF